MVSAMDEVEVVPLMAIEFTHHRVVGPWAFVLFESLQSTLQLFGGADRVASRLGDSSLGRGDALRKLLRAKDSPTPEGTHDRLEYP